MYAKVAKNYAKTDKYSAKARKKYAKVSAFSVKTAKMYAMIPKAYANSQ